MGFQKTVKDQPAPAVEGDFASNNPIASLTPPVAGAYVTGDANVRIGYFGFAANDGKVYSSKAAADAIGGTRVGFVARQPNIPSAMITAFLGEQVMTLQQGREVTLQIAGDYWANIPGAAANATVYALEATGAPSLVDDATTFPTGFAASSAARADAITAGTTTIAINTGIMTVLAMAGGSPAIEVGDRVTGTGVPAETYITRQLTGTPGGAGTYQTNSYNRAAVAAFTATMKQGTLAKISRPAQ